MLGQRPGQAWGAIVSAAHSACRERRLLRRARTAPAASVFHSTRVPACRSLLGSPARYFLPRGHLASTARERWQVFRQERSQEPVWPQDPRERFPCAVHNSPAERQPRSRGRELCLRGSLIPGVASAPGTSRRRSSLPRLLAPTKAPSIFLPSPSSGFHPPTRTPRSADYP